VRILLKLWPDPVIILIFCSRLSYASINRFSKISPTGFSVSLLSISVTILEPLFETSFPTAIAPEYNTGLRKGKGPLKKDPMPLAL